MATQRAASHFCASRMHFAREAPWLNCQAYKRREVGPNNDAPRARVTVWETGFKNRKRKDLLLRKRKGLLSARLETVLPYAIH